ncbi:prepilin-type N-terminal cleavage/methylation domain-containing protein [Desulfosporosinus sp. FKB]|uniref:type IV pilus modification PilV family protein n=1 Tax=Desulfosporosinus sp. FKB TaxID=1969835 RepID=UPI000B49774A|nr:prepilin-type N-terminal cleavage/methylation domain-containing protein [Desulfosporosinus sp. FKB]
MKCCKDDGMTILEVVIALTVLLIGVGFVAQSDSISYHYLAQQELRQQMVFFAAGSMEAGLEGESQDLKNGSMTSHYSSDVNIPNLPEGLTPFKVTVSAPGSSNVEMFNYRYNYDGQ